MSQLQDQFFFLHKKLDEIFDCVKEVKEAVVCPADHMFQFFAFDEAGGGLFDEEYVHTSDVNGTAVSTPRDPAWVNKSEAYADTVAEVNAIPGVSMTMVNDVAIADNGKVEYNITYPEDTTVTIVNTHTGDVYEFGTNEDGTCYGTVKDRNGDDITSYTPVEL